MRLFKFYQKSGHGTFLTFWKKLWEHKDFKIDSNVFLGKHFVLKFFGKKKALHRSKIGYSSFTKNHCM